MRSATPRLNSRACLCSIDPALHPAVLRGLQLLFPSSSEGGQSSAAPGIFVARTCCCTTCTARLCSMSVHQYDSVSVHLCGCVWPTQPHEPHRFCTVWWLPASQ